MTPDFIDSTSQPVMQTVLRHGLIARAGVAQCVDLSSGSMTKLTTPSVTTGVLKGQRPMLVKQLGRPTFPLVMVDGATGFVSVEVIPGGLCVVVIRLVGHVWATAVRPADTPTLESTVEAVVRIIKKFSIHGPSAAGVALAAAVDLLNEAHASPLLGWGNGNPTALMTETYEPPYKAANDVDVLTPAER